MTSGAVITGEQPAEVGGERTGEPATPVPITLAKALNLGLRSAMAADPKVIVMGEDVGTLGGVFRVTDGLQKEFGEARVIDTPLAESAIIGTAIGLAMRGYRPVCEIQFDGFVYPAFDQIVSQLAKLHYRSGGRIRLPVTIRIPFGGGIGAVEHHSESPEAYFCHTAGLKVVACSHPVDAHQMIQQAIRSDDPVIFLEPKRRYWEKAVVDPRPLGEVSPDGTTGLHSSAVVRAGTDATLVGYGPTVRTCLDAAEVSAADDGRSLEVVDLRSLSPLDLEPVLASVRRTGRLVVVHEAPSNVSVSAEVAARVAEQAFYSLEAPVLRVTGFDTPYPPARLEDHYLPDVDRILDAVDRSFGY
ncbi:pyruvate/2-oxoglutarate dehydrogenase complex, dehydrogenase component beta subunit [Frankia torreyi]|uniref:Pyruvate/2-oxoglutarate dehydrogenase complex, dehydrogenase component beta subunit n=2 Tax=Frankia TaxID=1854 RepID=A0A0D8BFB4_9ACTN|nr:MULTISPECIES: alpha-ketoacid dehydrogenase subunit beta [Frankia]KJE22831.1 pyruvate/2-oxoglutarate dehydrogenase complex, dehydrogenase component beta subunit [Frankia torreyi]